MPSIYAVFLFCRLSNAIHLVNQQTFLDYWCEDPSVWHVGRSCFHLSSLLHASSCCARQPLDPCKDALTFPSSLICFHLAFCVDAPLFAIPGPIQQPTLEGQSTQWPYPACPLALCLVQPPRALQARTGKAFLGGDVTCSETAAFCFCCN